MILVVQSNGTLVKSYVMSNETVFLQVGTFYAFMFFMKSFILFREYFDFLSGANVLAK